MTSPLLVKPAAPDAQGLIHAITPASAKWRYVGFSVRLMKAGQTVEIAAGQDELCLVLVSGVVTMRVDGKDFGRLGERMSPFDGQPWALYAPQGARVSVRAETDLELAVCSAPGGGSHQPRVIAPDNARQLQRGTGTNVRHPYNILPEEDPAHSLLVVEVITPGGHWSSYPPHKHDRDDFPNETYLEETYYHRMNRPGGFALQRIYDDEGTIDETIAASDRDVVLAPKGYHPVGAPHGVDLYYLNTMAGPKRAWKFHVQQEFRDMAGMASAPAAR
ncbi:MAG: 5-deoxy-glucuronate isomerase [Rhizobiales bacterium 65-9]|nr:5-deoxy-glucuronate isomerase [Hyphomicrobiales bacterium]OJY38202.1 MAG: 5-deoxy-glucuronate isomerase [Rhizobiales bacterium 65-9]